MAYKYFIIDDDKTCKDFNMHMMERKLKPIADIKINELDIGSKNGIKPIKTKISKNSITVTIECFNNPDKVYDDIREFINYLNPLKGERKIVFSDELDKCRYAILSNSDSIEYFYSQYLTFGKFDLTFTMYNPYTYSTQSKRFYYNGKGGATAKIMNSGGDICPLFIKAYAPKGIEVKKIENDNPSIVYNGNWSTYRTSYFSGGTSNFANDTGSSATLEFYGSGIQIYGLKSAGKGIANIYLDGELVERVNCYAPEEDWSVLLYGNNKLGNGNHTITVEVSGEKCDDAVGYQVNIDYFQVTSSSIPGDVQPLDIQGSTFSYETVPSISKLKIYINDEYVGYNSTISPTDTLTIDTDEYEMELNSINNLKHWIGDFPWLNVGENTIKVTDEENKGALIIFEFIERWL